MAPSFAEPMCGTSEALAPPFLMILLDMSWRAEPLVHELLLGFPLGGY